VGVLLRSSGVHGACEEELEPEIRREYPVFLFCF
jgi:hypothetical protein